MNLKLKKLFVLSLLCLFCILAATACGGGSDTTDAPGTTAPPDTQPIPERVEVCEPYFTVTDAAWINNALIRTDYNSYDQPIRTSFIMEGLGGLEAMYFEHIYDDNGLLTESKLYTPRDTYDLYCQRYFYNMTLAWTRDTAHRPIAASVVDYGTRSSLYSFYTAIDFTVSYHASGEMKRLECHNVDTKDLIYFADFDERGLRTVDGYLHDFGWLVENEYKYDGDVMTGYTCHTTDLDGTREIAGSVTTTYTDGILTEYSDSDGTVTSIEYTPDGKVLKYDCNYYSFYLRGQFTYDSSGLLTKYAFGSFSSTSGRTESVDATIVRDADGRATSLSYTTAGDTSKSTSKVKYEYPDESSIKVIKQSNISITATVYTFSEDGVLTDSEEHFTPLGDLVYEIKPYSFKTAYEYDSAGRPYKVTTYRFDEKGEPDGHFVDETVYESATSFVKKTKTRYSYRVDGSLSGTSNIK